MPSMEIVIDRQQRSLDPGAVRGQVIINLAATAENQHLLLDAPCVGDFFFEVQQ